MLLFVETTCPHESLFTPLHLHAQSSRDASNVCDGIGESDDGIVDDVVLCRSSRTVRRRFAQRSVVVLSSSGRNAKTTTDDHRCERNDDDDDGL